MSIKANIAEANTRSHGKNSISKLPYLDECPGFESTFTKSEASEQGTMLHAVMEKILDASLEHKETLTNVTPAVLADNAMDLTTEEREMIDDCTGHADYWLGLPGVTKIRQEQKVTIPGLTQGHYDLLIEFGDKAVLNDWKFGRVPVTPAHKNMQGIGYAVGCFLKYKHLTRIAIIFRQPRIHQSSEAVFNRKDLEKLLGMIERIIRDAEAPDNKKVLKVNQYCGYCSKSKDGSCGAFRMHLERAVSALSVPTHDPLPMPLTFDPSSIKTPDDAAKLMVWASILEPAFEQYRKVAKDIALANGGEIKTTIRGVEYSYKIATKSFPRSVRHPNLVAEVLKSVLTPEEILGSAKLSIGKLEDLYARKRAITPQEGDEGKITLKDAKLELESILSASDLMNQSEGQIEYLLASKNTATAPALTETAAN